MWRFGLVAILAVSAHSSQLWAIDEEKAAHIRRMFAAQLSLDYIPDGRVVRTDGLHDDVLVIYGPGDSKATVDKYMKKCEPGGELAEGLWKIGFFTVRYRGARGYERQAITATAEQVKAKSDRMEAESREKAKREDEMRDRSAMINARMAEAATLRRTSTDFASVHLRGDDLDELELSTAKSEEWSKAWIATYAESEAGNAALLRLGFKSISLHYVDAAGAAVITHHVKPM
jgi:hypothetical protein